MSERGIVSISTIVAISLVISVIAAGAESRQSSSRGHRDLQDQQGPKESRGLKGRLEPRERRGQLDQQGHRNQRGQQERQERKGQLDPKGRAVTGLRVLSLRRTTQ